MRSVRPAREPKNVARRREELLDAALRLFNEQGTAAVSTNHIAAAAGISAGNVYYWFPNKQAIVRALFERWRDASALPPVRGADPIDVLRSLLGVLHRQVALAQRFAVFARELVPLLHADEGLASRYRENYETRVAELVGTLAHLVEAGLLQRPEAPADLRSLVEVTWIATEQAPSFLAAMGAGHDPAATVRIVSAPLLAQLTPAGREALGSEGEAGGWR